MNVVITGASAGIGRAMVSTFARNGHSVLAVARREHRLLALSQEVEEAGQPKVHILAQDLSSPGAAKIVFEKAAGIFAKTHVLINNAGMSPYQEFEELNHTHLSQIIALNIRAISELCHLFLPHMLTHGEPSRVVNVGSVASYAPLPRFAVYSGSKHFLRVFTDILHREYAGTNIKVIGVYPGGTLTEFPALAGQKIKTAAQKTMWPPEKVANAAYPAILKGKRVIIIGSLNKLGVVIGKLLPFPWSAKVMEIIYDQSMDQVPTTYPL